MNSRCDRQRHLTVRFKQALAEQQSRAMITCVQAVDGVASADPCDNRLDILYSFPETTVGTILTGIDQIAGKAVQQPLNRFINALLIFQEMNERDHLLCAGGWHRYIEDIYLRYSDPGLDERIDIRRQTWRKYK